MNYTWDDILVASTYVEDGMCSTLKEALDMLEIDGLLDQQQEEVEDA